MKKILVSVAVLATALAVGCSSSSSNAPASGTSTDAGSGRDASAARDASNPTPSSDAGAGTDTPVSQGTGGSVTSDGGTCSFATTSPAEAYTGSDQNGDTLWLFYGDGGTTRIAIENYVGFGGPSAPGSYTLTADDQSYETCAFCIIYQTGCSGNSCAKTYMPVAGQGSISVTQLGGVAGHFAGDLNGLQFREVTIDPNTFVPTPVAADAGGATACLSGVHFDGLLDDAANMP